MIKRALSGFQILIIIVISSCSTQQYEVTSVKNANLSDEYALYYALPKTVLSFEVLVKKTDYIKGPYAQYAGKYLGLEKVVQNNETIYQLSDIKINVHAEPDPEQYYKVTFKKNAKKRNFGLIMEFTESGIIRSINEDSDETNRTEKKKIEVQEEEVLFDDFAKISAENNLFIKIDTIFEKITIDTVTIEKRILKKSLVEKSIEQKAKEAADFIMDIKEARFELLNGYGEVPYSIETIQFMSAELSQMEDDYLSLFIGKESSQFLKYTINYVPKEDIRSFPLAKFSEHDGLKDTSAVDGNYIYIDIESKGNTDVVSSYIKKHRKTSRKEPGFYYRIPEYTAVSIWLGDHLITQKDILIAQLGPSVALPLIKGGIEFFYETGAIKGIQTRKKL